MTRSEYWRCDAAALARLLDADAVTPADLLEMYLDRIDRLDPVLNAFAHIDRQGARNAAAEATQRQRDRRRLGPLDGIPVSVKDNIFVAGMPASWGSLMFRGHVPERDDICVERLRNAGAVIVGKTNTPEFSLLGRTESRLTGVTRNPWNPALTPGGSSGGAVAAVAAGMVPLSIGTDAGGSTRMPASYCGVVGLKPSIGRIARCYGFPPMALDFQVIGAMCRTMADLDLLLAALSGPDRRDPASLRLPPLDTPQGPLRIGWFTAIGDETVDDEVAHSHRRTREVLADLGHELVECEPPFDLAELRSLWSVLTPVGVASVASLRPGWESDATPHVANLARQSLAIGAVDYTRVIERLQAFRRETSQRWGAYDALLAPTTAAPAWPVELDVPATIAGRPPKSGTQSMFCGWLNAMGYPGLNVPGHPHPDGRPVGMQIIAPFGCDGIAIEIGRQLERRTGWSDRWPAMAVQ